MGKGRSDIPPQVAVAACCQLVIAGVWMWLAASAIMIGNGSVEYTCSYNSILNDKATKLPYVSSELNSNYSNCGNKMLTVNNVPQNRYSSTTNPVSVVELLVSCTGDCEQAMKYCKNSDSQSSAWDSSNNLLQANGGVNTIDPDCPIQLKILDNDINGFNTCDTDMGPIMQAMGSLVIILQVGTLVFMCMLFLGVITSEGATDPVCGMLAAFTGCCCLIGGLFGFMISLIIGWVIVENNDCETFNNGYYKDCYNWVLYVTIIIAVNCILNGNTARQSQGNH